MNYRPAARRVALFLVAVVLGVHVAGCDKHEPPTGPTPLSPTMTPVLDPIDARVAFESTRDGASYIYVATADGSQVRRLAAGIRPTWSPDGRQLAFNRNEQIFVIDSDGSGERSVTSGTEPSWSPDGTRMVVHRNGSGSGLFVVAVSGGGGGGATKLIDDGFVFSEPGSQACACSPVWSPDGQSIAFILKSFDDAWDLHVMSADGSNPHRVFPEGNGGGPFIHAAWLPDGLRLVVETPNGIGVASADGSSHSLPMAGPFYNPDWAPDGFVYVKHGSDGALRIFVASQPGNERQLIPGSGANTYYDDHPVWVRR